jgi:uncharacterized coiled-coil DUF342 family protein
MTKQSDFAKHMAKIDNSIADLIELIEQLGLNPNDESHCVKVLADLYDDIENATGMYY